LRRMSLNVGSSLSVLAGRCEAALFVPGRRRMEGLEALEYLYRWRRVCVAAAPLRALTATGG
jgi:hypothetical protein